jgi:hypothetical protein
MASRAEDVPDDLDDEPGDSRLSALVKMAREDFDEEPPARLDALLMAAARHHAPPPRAGAFERFRRWLGASLMNPAVAGAAALVLIGGTAGALYLRNHGKVAPEPTVSRQAAPNGIVAGRDQVAPEAAFRSQAPDEGTVAPSPDPTLGPARGPALDNAESQVREEVATAPKAKPRVTATGRGPDERTGTAGDGRFQNAPGGTGAGEGDGAGAVFGGVLAEDTANRGVGVKTEMHTTEAPPPPPPPPIEIAQDDELAEGQSKTPERVPPSTTVTTTADNSVGGRDGAASKRTQAENLLRQARTAAKKKNCPPVKVMAQRARQLDADYYKDTFTKDPDVKGCL